MATKTYKATSVAKPGTNWKNVSHAYDDNDSTSYAYRDYYKTSACHINGFNITDLPSDAIINTVTAYFKAATENSYGYFAGYIMCDAKTSASEYIKQSIFLNGKQQVSAQYYSMSVSGNELTNFATSNGLYGGSAVELLKNLRLRWVGGSINEYYCQCQVFDTYVTIDYTVPTYALDLKGKLDNGTENDNISNWGTADIYIKGSIVSSGVSDYYESYTSGTTYEVKNIVANSGYKYVGNSSYSGTLTSNTTIVLPFETKTACTITYNGNGATSGSVAAQSGYVGDSLTLRDNGFVKNGYTFLGWYTAASGGSKVTSPYTPTSASVTLYAQWERNSTNMIYIGTKQPTFYLGTRQVQSIYLGMSLIYEIVQIVDSGTCGSNLTYTLDSHGVLTISGTGDMQDSSLGWDTGLIKSVIINNGVTSIGNGAFNGCSSLPNITIPDGVTRIGNNAFSRCTGLTSVTIPDSVKSIGWGAFRGCASLTSITIPDSVTSIGEGAFHGCTGLTSITIPDSVTSIGDNPFRGCTGLIKITVSSGNTVYHSTDNCLIATKTKTLISGFKNSVIPSDGSVTSIGWGAFWGYSALTNIIIPDSVTSIGGYAFYSCTGLTSVTIPDSVTSIGESAFIYCTGLTEIDFSACTNIPILGSSNAFSNTSSSLVIKVPSALLDEWKAATNWATYADKMVGV